MPLPTPTTTREPAHTRTITCTGYKRDDGLWDIDGWITDVKAADTTGWERGQIPAGEPLHGMGLRMTIDSDFMITDMVAVQDYTPWRMCPTITPAFKKLIGLSLAKGFTKKVRELVGGIQGCVHLVDLLGPMATTAFQTLTAVRHGQMKAQLAAGEDVVPPFLNTCHTWASDSYVTKREFPKQYTGKD